MFLYSASIFLSAFLLFQIQPMIAKFILPWFGGTPAVWSTVMLFFQVLLTGGYAYAYWLIGRVKPRHQSLIHISLIALSMLLLLLLSTEWRSPITPSSAWKPMNVDSPVVDIFRLLVVSVGLPYFILAANGPLMQAWFARVFHGQSYARLYALSNLGSLFGLLAYPLWVEPSFSLRGQGWFWSLGFIFFGLIVIVLAVRSRYGTAPASLASVSRTEPPSGALRSLWIVLSALASLFLLSVTNQLTQEVAPIPFLWVLPLALYLLSFILTFSGERGYHRLFYAILFAAAAIGTVFVLIQSNRLHFYWQILSYCTLLFAACMLCHGELYRLRPAPDHLTTFYLMASIGGALGGIFVSLIAPLLFNGYWEFFVALAMTLALLVLLRRMGPQPLNDSSFRAQAQFLCTVFIVVTGMLVILGSFFSGALLSRRNFYGVIRVRTLVPDGAMQPAYVMSHGITVHGLQFVNPPLRNVPTTYYAPESGAGLAIVNHPKYTRAEPMQVGLLGLGVGTLAAYGRPGDSYRFYEINPEVAALAQGQGGYFSFLGDSEAEITTVLGDARISLERELAAGESQQFDILVLDTFSSDSIPVHLVTREAFAVYLAHLAPEGVLAAHITNLHLDLQPVLWQLAQEYGLHMRRVNYEGDSKGGYASHWILLARDRALLDLPAIQQRSVDLRSYSTALPLWTDDYSNLFQILK